MDAANVTFLVSINIKDALFPIFVLLGKIGNVRQPCKVGPRLEEIMVICALLHGVKHAKFLKSKVCFIPLVQ